MIICCDVNEVLSNVRPILLQSSTRNLYYACLKLHTLVICTHTYMCMYMYLYVYNAHEKKYDIYTIGYLHKQTNKRTHIHTQYTYMQTHFCNQRHEGRTEMIYFIQSNLSSVLNSVRRNVHFFRTIDTFQRLILSDDRSEQRSSRIRHLRDHGKINRIYYLKKIFLQTEKSI